MNPPYTEIIRGEVSIFRGGAGGLSYFSSGSFRGAGPVGASWAEAVVKAASETRQINGIAVETVEDLISGYVDWVVEALKGRSVKLSRRFATYRISNHSQALLLIQ